MYLLGVSIDKLGKHSFLLLFFFAIDGDCPTLANVQFSAKFGSVPVAQSQYICCKQKKSLWVRSDSFMEQSPDVRRNGLFFRA